MINVRVRDNKQIIVPIRFARAVTGAAQVDAPDVDDRGFEMGTRSPTWGASDTRGAMVGIMKDDRVRIRVLRPDIDPGAQLFATSTDTGVIQVAEPPGGGPLVNDIFQILGVADYANRPVKVQIHLGAANGPVIGELEPHVFIRRRARVRVHRCRIQGTPVMSGGNAIPELTGRSDADIDDMFQVVNNIWRPTGVEFSIVSRRTPTIQLMQRTPAITQSVQGCVAIDNSVNEWAIQHDELLGRDRMANAVNVYFVRRIWNVQEANGGGTRGIGTSSTANPYGVTLPDDADTNDLAHELGHVLNLDFHAGAGFGHANDTAASVVENNAALRDGLERHTAWTRRRLMYAYNPIGFAGDGSPAYMTDIGYGNYVRGALITVKNIDGDSTDGETAEANRRARNLP